MQTPMSSKYLLFTLFLISFLPALSAAQLPDDRGDYYRRSATFRGPEQLHYTVYFRWGIIKGTAGKAVIKTSTIPDHRQWFQQVRFRTSGIFETVFPMRDTLEVLYDHKKLPLRSEKRTDDGGYYSVDEITYSYDTEQTRMRMRRLSSTELLLDTVLQVKSGKVVADMQSAFNVIRGIDRSKIRLNYRVAFVIPVGKDLIPCEIVYSGREVYRMPDGEDREVLRFFLNIEDDAFSKKKQSAELWVTDDDYLVPVKIRTKLKVGYAECLLSSVTRQ